MDKLDKFKTDPKYSKLTPFQIKVLSLVSLIPKGQVTSYKHLAHLLNHNSPRAIGHAISKNPFAPQIPCHRVVGSELTLKGYLGKSREEALKKKQALLEAEGISFSANKVNKKHLWLEKFETNNA